MMLTDRRSLFVDLLGAIASASCMAAITHMLHSNDGAYFQRLWVRDFFIALACYSAVALLLHRYWRGNLRRMVPSWSIIAVMGTLLFVNVSSLPAMVIAWKNHGGGTAFAFVRFAVAWVLSQTTLVAVFSIVALLVTSAIYYANSAVRWMHQPPNR